MKANKSILLICVALGFSLIMVSCAYFFALNTAMSQLTKDATISAQLRADTLLSELDKQRAVPVILASDRDLISALEQPTISHIELSQKLESLAKETKSAVIYVLDENGITIASSNWRDNDSFVGNNYNFRPYFIEAKRNGSAEQIALGTVSHKPGLYLAHDVKFQGKLIGVVVTKVEIETIEQKWSKGEDITFVTNPEGQILLTNRPELRFKNVPKLDSNSIRIHLPSPSSRWNSYLLRSKAAATKAALTSAIIGALLSGLIIIMAIWSWRRSQLNQQKVEVEKAYRDELEARVASRTNELSGINQRLSSEIKERKAAEKRLASMQIDLVQANKLAALGQITAGVAHEINQPVATFKILSNNASLLLSKSASALNVEVATILSKITQMSDRIGHITMDLLSFSRKGSSKMEPVAVNDLLETSLLLTQSRIRDFNVVIVQDIVPENLLVMGNRIKLEQVIVNLLQNASEAIEGHPEPNIKIGIETTQTRVKISITDNGPGLNSEIENQIFVPFVTSKPNGLGLGLVIAKDILQELGGSLTLKNSKSGACFTVDLIKADL